MAIRTAPYVEGQPVNGWTTGFPWKPEELKAPFNADLDNMTKVVNVAKELVSVIDKLDTVIGDVQANGYEDRANLPPFPLPGTLASLKLSDLTVANQAVATLLEWATKPVAFVQFDAETGDPIPNPPTVRPIDVLRRIAKSSR